MRIPSIIYFFRYRPIKKRRTLYLSQYGAMGFIGVLACPDWGGFEPTDKVPHTLFLPRG